MIIIAGLLLWPLFLMVILHFVPFLLERLIDYREFSREIDEKIEIKEKEDNRELLNDLVVYDNGLIYHTYEVLDVDEIMLEEHVYGVFIPLKELKDGSKIAFTLNQAKSDEDLTPQEKATRMMVPSNPLKEDEALTLRCALYDAKRYYDEMKKQEEQEEYYNRYKKKNMTRERLTNVEPKHLKSDRSDELMSSAKAQRAYERSKRKVIKLGNK